MNTIINWTKLVVQNRAKAIGVPWTREDEKALKEGVSAEDVRAGLYTKEEVEAANKKKETDFRRLPINKLNATAKDLGLDYDKDVISRADLINEIEAKTERGEKLLDMTRPELSRLAKGLDVEFVYAENTKSDLVKLIEEARLK